MCGIAGFLGAGFSGDESLKTVLAMSGTLLHRGPDDGGVWVDARAGVALGHRRLSILDLSPQGRQPMHSACGRYVVVFNGEIYNHRELRKELESRMEGGPIAWRGTSDTEVLLAAVSRWGLGPAIRRFIGMFAFALWDRRERTLHLVRDRLGEKPLYYGVAGGILLFGSELKALRAHPAWRGEIDRDALALYMRHNYIPSPRSIYRGIGKLPPGVIATIRGAGDGGDSPSLSISCDRYWSAGETAKRGAADPFDGTEAEGVKHLDGLLRDAIGRQMVADVPLGAFLSGGVDSSTVAALMQAQSGRPVKTFTIGFHESDFNEAEHAKAVARHLGTDHTELYVTPEECMAVIPRLPRLYDEPFSDSSQIPTFLVSQMARRDVTVSLSGDGGDELFGGYNRYLFATRIWSGIGRVPRGLRGVAACGLAAVRPARWDRLFAAVSPVLPDRVRQRMAGDRVHKFAGLLTIRKPEELYLALVSHWEKPDAVVLGAREPETAMSDSGRWVALPDFVQRMMCLDTFTYLPDDLMVKVDRASMGVSLESRAPFLDHRVVEFAWRIPMSMKIRDRQGKWILRQVLYRYVPPALIERAKMGFGVPIGSWLRGPLREWAEELLEERRLRAEGFFRPGPIREKWTEHMTGRRNWQYDLWDVLMFQAWLEHSRAA